MTFIPGDLIVIENPGNWYLYSLVLIITPREICMLDYLIEEESSLSTEYLDDMNGYHLYTGSLNDT